jgi:MYXO-CTERM domain-containing protein
MKTCIALAMAAGFVSAANAQVILDQRPSDFQNGLISETSPGLEARSADDVSLPFGNGANYNITKLCGVMLTNTQLGVAGGMFEVYADGGGLPTGAPLFTFAADAVVNVGTAFGFQAQEYSVGNGVNTLFSLAAGATYWVSAVGTDPNPGQYFATYNFGGPVNGNQGAFIGAAFGVPNWTTCDSQFGTPSDFAFCIEGRQVPAPGALALLGLGGLVAGRRRRA